MNALYLLCLLASLAGVALLDARFRLAAWARPVTTVITVLINAVFFGLWDAAGIASGVFLHQNSPWATGIMLASQFPLEEAVFLVFLGYLTLVLLAAAQRTYTHLSTRENRGSGRRADQTAGGRER